MGRIAGVDYGTRKVGLSLADPLRMFARSIGTYAPDECIRVLRKLNGEEGIDKLVVGWPPALSSEEGRIHKSIREWVAAAKKALGGVEVVLVDESFSSREAEEKLAEAGLGKAARRRKGRVDRAAAAIILQRYLDEELEEDQ